MVDSPIPEYAGTNAFSALLEECQRSEELAEQLHALTSHVQRQTDRVRIGFP
jgi:hypothetical protein